jgi:hypothetical protein
MVQTLTPKRRVKLHIPSPRLEEGAQAEWFEDALVLPDDRLVDALRRHIQAEYDLPADERRRAVAGRLRAWLRLGERAHRLVACYEKASAALPFHVERARLEAERDAVMNGLSYAEFRRLAEVVPWLRTWDGSFESEYAGPATDRTLATAAALVAQMA